MGGQNDREQAQLKAYFELSDSDMVNLVQCVDESAFTLEDWVNALISMQQYLKSKSLTLGFKDSLDYIHCASTASPNKNPIEPLTELTLEFLNLYGCERAIKIT